VEFRRADSRVDARDGVDAARNVEATWFRGNRCRPNELE
jgi:hypothetical protein